MPGSLSQRRGLTGERDRTCGRAVVAAVRGEHLVPAGVQPRHADRVLVGLRAAVGEEHHVEIAGRTLGDEPRRLAADVDRERGRHGAEPRRLLLDRGDHPRVLVAEVEVDELRREVEVPVAVGIPEVRTLAAGNRNRIDHLLGGPRVEDVGAVVGANRVGVAHDCPDTSTAGGPASRTARSISKNGRGP